MPLVKLRDVARGLPEGKTVIVSGWTGVHVHRLSVYMHLVNRHRAHQIDVESVNNGMESMQKEDES